MLEMDFVPSERKPGEDGAHVKSIKSIKSWDSTASTHAQDVFQLRTEVTEDLSPRAWNTDVVEANHDLETGANAECSEAPVKPGSEEKVPETSRKQKEVWYVLMTVLYFVYRSQEESIFTPAAFSLRWNDLVGLIFIGSFLLTRKPSYLVYAINPFRNLVMILLQTIWPRMKAEETNPEYYRNIASASIQLCSAYAIWLLTTPQPIEVGTRWAEMSCLERWSTCFQGRLSCLKKWLMRVDNFLLVATGIAACLIAMKKQTHEFHSLHTEDHGWKIILSVVLGVAEEVTWRSVYMADNNNAIQAFTWGVNHIVAGTGMSNPWLYGVVSGSYAFCLGATPYVLLRFFHHAAVEYFVIDNLVKPEGHPIWLTQSVV